MASFKHRILVPTPTEPNGTVSCPLDCFDRCPPGCLPFDYSSPPPPPPPFFPNEQSNQNGHISPHVIIIVAVLGSCFLLVSYYAIIVKYCSSWNNPSRRAPEPANTRREFLDEDNGPVVDHHIWFITTVGLDPSIINSIAVCKYKKGDGLVEGTECSVCLNEFQEDETLRFLPKCSHAFHIPCIDTWLRSHTNCPLCRAHIVSNHVGSTSTAPVPNLNDSRLGEETQVENSVSDGGLGSDDNRDNLMSDPREELQDVEITEEGVPPPLPNSEIRALSDLGDNNRTVENEIQRGRRSVSLDFSMFCFSVANIQVDAEVNSPSPVVGGEKSNLEITPSKFRMMGSSSKERLLHKGAASVKRSFSTRHSQNPRSILPY